MRLFTALDISAGARAALTEILAYLSPAAGFRWSGAGNLHVTTKFIGAWPPDRYEELCNALWGIPRPGSFEISIEGLSWFPNPHSPRVLFAGVSGGTALQQLHARTDAACAALGIPGEAKAFTPHLTLARVASSVGLSAVRRKIAQLPVAQFGRYPAKAFHLYESVPAPEGSQYIKREEFPLS